MKNILCLLFLSWSLSLTAAPVLPATPPRTNVVLLIEWSPPTDLTGITGYIIRHGTEPGVVTDQMLVTGPTSTNTYWSNVVIGVTHYFVASSVNSAGLESVPSNTAEFNMAQPAPPQLKQIVPMVVMIESRPAASDPWVERLRFSPFNALAALPGEQFRVKMVVSPPEPLLPP